MGRDRCDGTRQAARQRALPQTDGLPAPHHRFDQVCAPGYTGRKRGEVVRTRTVMLQAHTHQLLGTFGGAGNGDYRGELKRAIRVSRSYATHFGLSLASILVRLDGLYGDAAPLLDVLSANLTVIVRSRASASAGSGCGETSPDPRSRAGEHSRGKQHDTCALRLCIRSLDASRPQRAFGGRDSSGNLL